MSDVCCLMSKLIQVFCFSNAGETRFYTEFIAAQRLLEVKEDLQATYVSKDFNDWAHSQSFRLEALRFKKLILSEELWIGVEGTVALFEPIVKLLRLVDSDISCMGKVRSAGPFLYIFSILLMYLFSHII